MDKDVPTPGTIVAAFTEEHVQRLTGLSARQLRYWDRTDFFVPSFAEENRRVPYSRVYSFKDLVALRVLSVLRNQYGVPLQHLRKVADKLSHLADDKWVTTTLYVLNRKVVFQDPDSEELREVVSGQYVIGIPLKTIIADTERDVAQLRRRPAEKIGMIERSRRVAHNAPVVAGTRIPVSAIRNFHEAGYSVAQILGEYPDLTEQDVAAALSDGKNSAAA